MHRRAIWVIALAALPSLATAGDPPAARACCILTLPPSDPLLDRAGPPSAPGPELPAPEPSYGRDLRHQPSPLEPPMHPRARGSEANCAAPPDTAWGNWYKEGMAYTDHGVAEPLRGRSAALPFRCY
jgi:hypothetical protein